MEVEGEEGASYPSRVFAHSGSLVGGCRRPTLLLTSTSAKLKSFRMLVSDSCINFYGYCESQVLGVDPSHFFLKMGQLHEPGVGQSRRL
jgi:hypothetical protein